MNIQLRRNDQSKIMNTKTIQLSLLLCAILGTIYLSFIFPGWIYYLIIPSAILVSIHLICQIFLKLKKSNQPAKIVHHKMDACEQPMVSIHIPISNEPPELVIRSLKACLSQNYHNFEVIILDNNTQDINLWKPVEDFCRNHEILKYHRYPKLEGFKAGALDKCIHLSARSTKYIMVIDADYCLKTYALKEAVIEAEKNQLDLLQFPQAYRNINFRNESLAMEYQHYFDIYATAANTDKAMLSTGTLCLFRFESLKELPGWKNCQTITEDAEIGIQFIKARKHTAFSPKILGYGIMPQNAIDVGKQRARWIFGNMHTLLNNKWNLGSKRDLNIIMQLTAWLNFLMPVYLALFTLLLVGSQIYEKTELNLILIMGAIPFLINLLGKSILFYRPSLSRLQILRTLAIHIHFNFRSSIVWLPCLLGGRKPFYRTPKDDKQRRNFQFTDVTCLLFFAIGIMAFMNDLVLPATIYTLLGNVYLFSTLHTLNALKYSETSSRINLKLQTNTL